MSSPAHIHPVPHVGGIVLCGGKSSRMGQPKAWLPFGPEVLLQRVVRVLQSVVSPVVVVAARQQELPPLPENVLVVRDEQEALGPLGGLATGLPALPPEITAAYVSACDVPFLSAEFIRALISRLEGADLVIPRDGKYHHPLAAVYRTTLLPHVHELIAAGQLRPFFLLERVRSCEVPVDELRGVDPRLDSLRNTNTPEDYAAALRDSGFEVPARS